MLEYNKNPLAKGNPLTDFMRAAREFGPYEAGHYLNQRDAIQRKQERYFLNQIMGKVKDGWTLTDALGAMKDVLLSAPRLGSWVFEMSDNTHRLASWKMITDDLMKNPTTLRKLWHGLSGRAAPADKCLSTTLVHLKLLLLEEHSQKV
jgi:hypothetical protein